MTEDLGEPQAAGRRRRRRQATEVAWPRDPEQAARCSFWAILGMAGLSLYGIFAGAAPPEWLHGVLWVGLGALLVFLPPQLQLRGAWWVGGLGLLAGAAMAFLPASWFGVPEWRRALVGLGVDVGSLVTMQPRQSAEIWAGLALSVTAAWYVLGHRVSNQAHLGLASAVALGLAGYGAVSMWAAGTAPRWAWDPEENFGLFGNRNHTATVLVMGVMCALGVLMEGVREKRGGVAGLGSLALVVCLWGLLGFSSSRAGLLLLLVSGVAWLLGMGKRYLSGRLLVTVLAFSLAAAGAFLGADTSLRQRFERSMSQVEGQALAAAEGGDVLAQPYDFRMLVYGDVLDMLAREPIVGVGLGQFAAVFPQHRERAAILAKCWHPESNWLAVAAEAGLLTAAVLAAVVGGLFWQAFRAGRSHRAWPLTLGTLLAALVVPLHGLFDVPGHHAGIAWLGLVLLALSFRLPDAPSLPIGRIGRGGFRAAGLVILLGGLGFLLRSGPTWRPDAKLAAERATATAKVCYERAQLEASDPIGHPAEVGTDGAPIDPLVVAFEAIEQALRMEPLHPELHYWRGLLAVNFPEGEPIADQAFAVQRVLEPDWPEVPFRQAKAWMPTDPARSLALWRECLVRIKARESSLGRQDAYWNRLQFLEKARQAALPYPKMAEAFAQLAAEVRS